LVEKMKAMNKDYIINRLSEASTWRGLVGLLTAFGIVLSPEQVVSFMSAGTALIALINVFRKESASPDGKLAAGQPIAVTMSSVEPTPTYPPTYPPGSPNE
jgi:hypothetical protein